jgi:hypothetical protein
MMCAGAQVVLRAYCVVPDWSPDRIARLARSGTAGRGLTPTDLQSVPLGVYSVKLSWLPENRHVNWLSLEQLGAIIATNCGLAADWSRYAAPTQPVKGDTVTDSD